jgi:hypothetical protein
MKKDIVNYIIFIKLLQKQELYYKYVKIYILLIKKYIINLNNITFY